MARPITSSEIERAAAAGWQQVHVPADAIVTAAAWDRAAALGVAIVRGGDPAGNRDPSGGPGSGGRVPAGPADSPGVIGVGEVVRAAARDAREVRLPPGAQVSEAAAREARRQGTRIELEAASPAAPPVAPESSGDHRFRSTAILPQPVPVRLPPNAPSGKVVTPPGAPPARVTSVDAGAAASRPLPSPPPVGEGTVHLSLGERSAAGRVRGTPEKRECTRSSPPPPLRQAQGRPQPAPDEGAGVDLRAAELSPLVYRPRTLVVGLGCVRGATVEEIDRLLQRTFQANGLALASIRELATIDVKRDEAGITALAERYGRPVRYFTAAELSRVQAPSGASAEVQRAVGAPGVCEPAALLAAGAAELVVPKAKTDRVTLAVARLVAPPTEGRLAIVGIGPGDPEQLTFRARRALEAADVVVGYQGYLDQVRPWLGATEYRGSPIGDEAGRCRLAIDLSRVGRRVALISSGDAGIYAMAGLVLELLEQDGAAGEADRVEIIPGITAAQAAAAILGAPLMSDFVVLSLSDLMTPWPVIERRVEAAGAGDLVVALYNPASAKRQRQLRTAVEVLLRYRSPETPVGVVRNASRPDETTTLTTLGRLLEHPIDMFTLVLIGNSATIRVGNRLVTRRGYLAGDSLDSRAARPGPPAP